MKRFDRSERRPPRGLAWWAGASTMAFAIVLAPSIDPPAAETLVIDASGARWTNLAAARPSASTTEIVSGGSVVVDLSALGPDTARAPEWRSSTPQLAGTVRLRPPGSGSWDSPLRLRAPSEPDRGALLARSFDRPDATPTPRPAPWGDERTGAVLAEAQPAVTGTASASTGSHRASPGFTRAPAPSGLAPTPQPRTPGTDLAEARRAAGGPEPRWEQREAAPAPDSAPTQLAEARDGTPDLPPMASVLPRPRPDDTQTPGTGTSLAEAPLPIPEPTASAPTSGSLGIELPPLPPVAGTLARTAAYGGAPDLLAERPAPTGSPARSSPGQAPPLRGPVPQPAPVPDSPTPPAARVQPREAVLPPARPRPSDADATRQTVAAAGSPGPRPADGMSSAPTMPEPSPGTAFSRAPDAAPPAMIADARSRYASERRGPFAANAAELPPVARSLPPPGTSRAGMPERATARSDIPPAANPGTSSSATRFSDDDIPSPWPDGRTDMALARSTPPPPLTSAPDGGKRSSATPPPPLTDEPAGHSIAEPTPPPPVSSTAESRPTPEASPPPPLGSDSAGRSLAESRPLPPPSSAPADKTPMTSSAPPPLSSGAAERSMTSLPPTTPPPAATSLRPDRDPPRQGTSTARTGDRTAPLPTRPSPMQVASIGTPPPLPPSAEALNRGPSAPAASEPRGRGMVPPAPAERLAPPVGGSILAPVPVGEGTRDASSGSTTERTEAATRSTLPPQQPSTPLPSTPQPSASSSAPAPSTAETPVSKSRASEPSAARPRAPEPSAAGARETRTPATEVAALPPLPALPPTAPTLTPRERQSDIARAEREVRQRRETGADTYPLEPRPMGDPLELPPSAVPERSRAADRPPTPLVATRPLPSTGPADMASAPIREFAPPTRPAPLPTLGQGRPASPAPDTSMAAASPERGVKAGDLPPPRQLTPEPPTPLGFEVAEAPPPREDSPAETRQADPPADRAIRTEALEAAAPPPAPDIGPAPDVTAEGPPRDLAASLSTPPPERAEAPEHRALEDALRDEGARTAMTPPTPPDAASEAEEAARSPGPIADLPEGETAETIEFRPGTVDLPDDANERLRALVERLTEDESRNVQIVAFASEGGDGPANAAKRTSLSRALAVRSFLIKEGIRSTRINVRALGAAVEQDPADKVELRVLAS